MPASTVFPLQGRACGIEIRCLKTTKSPAKPAQRSTGRGSRRSLRAASKPPRSKPADQQQKPFKLKLPKLEEDWYDKELPFKRSCCLQVFTTSVLAPGFTYRVGH
ncbi:hypothetical protein WJX72_009854 [[Myrmecia] bisecta]|uniref:Uncharacterized protein n=1 Tax=[Myrmecia] bisecta TaxID=41462 RepID=A0AAW1Q8H5_9CHLO